MAMGRLVFMVVLHLLRFTLPTFLKYIILQKIWVVGIQFEKYSYRF